MKIKLPSRCNGIALIMVMIVIAVFAILAGAFAYSMRVEIRLARNSNNESQFEWLGRSGIELARFVLAQQVAIGGPRYDSLNQKWAGGPMGTNEVLAAISMENNQIGNGVFSIKITDLERKANINMGRDNPDMLKQGMFIMGVDASAIDEIADSIQDWLDADEDAHSAGAESSYYQSLSPAYFSKNGLIDDLSELLLIKGVTPEIYWGSNSTNHPASSLGASQQGVFDQLNGMEEAGYAFGLVDVFTPVSNGRLNINTASVTGLQMIPGVDENIALEIISTRAGQDGADGTEDDFPFQNAGELRNVPGLTATEVNRMTRYCTVVSSFFEATIDCEIDGVKRQYIAILRRNNNDVQLLNFYWK